MKTLFLFEFNKLLKLLRPVESVKFNYEHTFMGNSSVLKLFTKTQFDSANLIIQLMQLRFVESVDNAEKASTFLSKN